MFGEFSLTLALSRFCVTLSEATRGPQWESRPAAVRNLEATRRHPQRRFSLPHSAESVSEHRLENSREML